MVSPYVYSFMLHIPYVGFNLFKGLYMKVIRYSLLVVLVSSSFCHGFTAASIKHGSAGVGKLGLGLICATVAASALTMRIGSSNIMCHTTQCALSNLHNEGITSFLFTKTHSICLDVHLTMSITIASMIGMSGYGAYKCVASAGESFKEGWATRKEPTNRTDFDSSEIPATLSQTSEVNTHYEEVDDFIESKSCPDDREV